jgi:hypothetical protein
MNWLRNLTAVGLLVASLMASLAITFATHDDWPALSI